jgi:hypothetical protein
MLGLDGTRVLIVEDEYLIADDLARYFTALGAQVLGPVSTVADAYAFTEQADAAVLDINLRGSPVFPIADRLIARFIPIVFYSGYEKNIVPARLQHVCNLAKPASRRVVADALFPQPGHRAPQPTDDIPSLLPKLRLAARLLLSDEGAADRLVEQVLKQAIRSMNDGAEPGSTEEWLNGLLRRAATLGPGLLN